MRGGRLLIGLLAPVLAAQALAQAQSTQQGQQGVGDFYGPGDYTYFSDTTPKPTPTPKPLPGASPDPTNALGETVVRGVLVPTVDFTRRLLALLVMCHIGFQNRGGTACPPHDQ